MKKKIALLSALALISMTSCSNSAASTSTGEQSSSESSVSNSETTEENSSDTSDTTESPDDSAKDPDKFNTYPMSELYGEDSPLIGYWHTDGRDMYIEYNEFGSEGFTVFILGGNLQIFSSQIGTFSGTPQNTEYILASSEDDADVANLFNKGTKFNMAVNDDNSISVFLDFGYSKTSTYTFEKSHISAEQLAPYCGTWSDGKNNISFTANEGRDRVEFQTIFGFSTDQYPVGIPSVTDENECWLCCPYKKGMLTDYSDQGVYMDVINIHMEFNSDGSVNLNRSYTSPILINSGISSAGTVVRKIAE
ncbi:MAG: hypothetical protein IJ779_10470 [Ruminococcus sp.]|nr:hypothetical protein [Ruminococcus sp.]